MKTFALNAEVREASKIANKALRNQGKVPCVLYGGDKQVCFSTKENDLNKLINTPDVFLINFELEEKSYQAIVQDVQFHPVTDRILHIDFYQLFEDKPVTMQIPVRLQGNSPGVMNGGRLMFRKRKLTVKALPANLPDVINVDISKLRIGGNISVTNVLSDDYTFLHPDNTTIVQVKTSRNAVDDEEEETEEGEEGGEAEAPAAE